MRRELYWHSFGLGPAGAAIVLLLVASGCSGGMNQLADIVDQVAIFAEVDWVSEPDSYSIHREISIRMESWFDNDTELGDVIHVGNCPSLNLSATFNGLEVSVDQGGTGTVSTSPMDFDFGGANTCFLPDFTHIPSDSELQESGCEIPSVEIVFYDESTTIRAQSSVDPATPIASELLTPEVGSGGEIRIAIDPLPAGDIQLEIESALGVNVLSNGPTSLDYGSLYEIDGGLGLLLPELETGSYTITITGHPWLRSEPTCDVPCYFSPRNWLGVWCQRSISHTFIVSS